jgi:hypothetical protein
MAKSKLPKFTLTHNEQKARWELGADKSNQVVKTFDTKADATAGGALKKGTRRRWRIGENPESGWQVSRGTYFPKICRPEEIPRLMVVSYRILRIIRPGDPRRTRTD